MESCVKCGRKCDTYVVDESPLPDTFILVALQPPLHSKYILHPFCLNLTQPERINVLFLNPCFIRLTPLTLKECVIRLLMSSLISIVNVQCTCSGILEVIIFILLLPFENLPHYNM